MESRMQMLAGYIFVSVYNVFESAGIETRRHRKPIVAIFAPGLT
jgi:hypothetical protein